MRSSLVLGIAAVLAATIFPFPARPSHQDGSGSSPTRAATAPTARVRPDDVAVVVIDVQEPFVSMMSVPSAPVLARIEQLLLSADYWGVPVIATLERQRQGGAVLIERLASVLPAGSSTLPKSTFDATREPAIAAALRALGKRQIAVVGCETDVCVLQTVLGLLDMGFEVFLLEDAVFSHENGTMPALRRMEAAGAVPTTMKSFYFEMEGRVGAAPADDDQRARWERLRNRLRSPYDLPPSAQPR